MSDPLQASLLRLAANGTSVFSPHTSLDATPNGINTWLVRPFLPFSSTSTPISNSAALPGFEGAGMGKIVTLKESLRVSEIVKLVKEHLRLEHVQLAKPDPEKAIQSIAVCAGSGMPSPIINGEERLIQGGSMLKDVEVDLLLTGEMSHHEVLAAVARGQSVILCNHSNTERPYLSDVLQPWLEKELNSEDGQEGWEVVVSKTDKDPLAVV